MAERITTDDDPLSIAGAIAELWDRAKSNPSFTTSEKLQAIDPEMAKAYRLQKEIRDAVKQIQANMEKEQQERSKVKEAGKRSVKQFLKLIGWLD